MIELTECLSLSEGTVRVDRERGTIANVKVLGWKSANGREYLKTSVKPSLYEGRRVCVGHVKDGRERSPLDTYGVLEGIEVKDAGVYARQLRLLNPQGEFEKRLLAAAESAPHLFGLSHTARGKERPGSGGGVIESVESVQSVDLVSDPATVAGLYESRTKMKTLSDLIEDLDRSRPVYAACLREMAEAGILPGDAPMMDPGSDDNGADHEQAILDACKVCIDDTSLSPPEKLKKIRHLLKIVNGHGNSGGGDDEPDDNPDDYGSKKKESKVDRETANLREQVARYESRERVRAAAAAAKVEVPQALLESLAPGLTEQQARAMVAAIKATQGTSSVRPRSATPSRQQQRSESLHESNETPPTNQRELGRWLNGR